MTAPATLLRTRWVRHELQGEPWLAARFTIAPLRLPAFSVTWFRVESDRARHRGAYRLRSELLEAGSIPGWVLLLGAMGLHVYGEGEQLIVQDRPGQGEVFDAYRLLLLEVFIAWNVDHTVGGAPLPSEPSELALLVREKVDAGFWDLPALQPMPGHAATAAEYEGQADATRGVPGVPRTRVEDFPRAEAYRQFLRSGLHPSHHPARHAPASWARPAPTHVFVPQEPWFRSWWAKPRTPMSRVLFWFLNSGKRESKGEQDAIVALFVFLVSVLLLPFLVLYWVLQLLAHPLYLLLIMVEYVALPPMEAPPESVRPRAFSAPVDPRQPFVQLHDALTYEGFRRLEAKGARSPSSSGWHTPRRCSTTF